MISLLISLTILFTSIPFLAYLLKTTVFTSNYDEISIYRFFQYVRDDFIESKSYTTGTDVIYLETDDGKTATIEKYKDTIRRRVDLSGHEIYLRDVKELLITPLSYGIQITIVSLQGDRYEKTIVHYE